MQYEHQEFKLKSKLKMRSEKKFKNCINLEEFQNKMADNQLTFRT